VLPTGTVINSFSLRLNVRRHGADRHVVVINKLPYATAKAYVWINFTLDLTCMFNFSTAWQNMLVFF
jgi:hypothetical protein